MEIRFLHFIFTNFLYILYNQVYSEINQMLYSLNKQHMMGVMQGQDRESKSI